MKSITKLHLKVFLFTGVTYGLILFLLDLMNKNEFALSKLLFMTLFFGITMSLTLVSLHKYRLKKIGIQEITDENLNVNQSKTLSSELNTAALIEILASDSIIGKMKMIETKNGIHLKTGISWKSWGENIKITLKSEQDSRFEYEISSSPKLKTTIVDYGKNLENIKRIEKLIKNPNTLNKE